MNRTTKQQLINIFSFIVEQKILPEITGHTWVLDDYAPPGNKYRYAIALRENTSGAEWQIYNERFSVTEMRALLKGMVMPFEVMKNFARLML
jgi:hypothetical protein